jgi:hypothetical protein
LIVGESTVINTLIMVHKIDRVATKLMWAIRK